MRRDIKAKCVVKNVKKDFMDEDVRVNVETVPTKRIAVASMELVQKAVFQDIAETRAKNSVMVICMEKTAASHVATVRTVNNVITLMELV